MFCGKKCTQYKSDVPDGYHISSIRLLGLLGTALLKFGAGGCRFGYQPALACCACDDVPNANTFDCLHIITKGQVYPCFHSVKDVIDQYVVF